MYQVTEQVAYWLGAVLTDGSFQVSNARKRHHYAISLSSIDREFCEAFAEGAEELTGTSPIVFPQVLQSYQRHKLWGVATYNKELWGWAWEQTAGKTAVPTSILKGDRTNQVQFLAGCMDGDGYVNVNTHPHVAKNPRREMPKVLMQIGIAACDRWIYDLHRLSDHLELRHSGPTVKVQKKQGWRDVFSLRYHTETFVRADIPLRIQRKQDKLEHLRRYFESPETTRLARS